MTPDILCTAKGITNAMMPLGVVATSRAIADHFEETTSPTATPTRRTR